MALNDPQWGRRGNDGTPDLDELWKRFRQKLPGMGGGRTGRDGGGPSPRQFRGGALILIVLVVVVWLLPPASASLRLASLKSVLARGLCL